jgi:hypothetical protein
MTGQILEEWAEWLFQWLEIYRAEHGLEASPAVLFLDNAPSRNHERAMRVFLEHNVRVILFPPHMTHVMQPEDICWARPFKSKTAEAWNRHLTKPGVAEASFAELKEDMRKASEKHRVRVRVRMLFSIYEAAPATTVASFACRGP